MDYSGILKRAWQITWKYKVLWLFGLFAGGMGGGFSGNNFNNTSNRGVGTGSGNSGFPSGFEPQFAEFARRGLPLIIALTVLLVVIGLVWWVISIAARGGIIHLVNEAEEGRPVRAGEGWSVGFSKWGRIFGILFLAGLPSFILVLVMVGLFVALGFGGVIAGLGNQDGAAAASAIGALGGMCCVGFVFLFAAIVVGVVLGIVAELATRYAVLKDFGVMDSLREGWSDVRAKRGAFLMYLIQWGVSIAYSIAVGIVALVLIVPGAIIIFTGAWPVGLLMIVLAGLVLMVPAAAYGAFYHTVWTVFFRRMTGMESPATVSMPGAYPAAPAPVGGFPPPPPAAYEPPAPLAGPDPWKAASGVPDDPAAPAGTPPAGG